MGRASYYYAHERLGNGLEVVTVRMPHLHSAHVALYARVGSRHETAETNGLSHFLEHMYFRGCEGYPDSTSLNAAMEDLGGALEGYTLRDMSSYQSTVHPDFVGEALEIYGAMFKAPRFADIDIERQIILEEILDALDERGRVIELDTIAHRVAFGEHALAQSIDGPRKNLRRFSVDDLEQHRGRFYGARNLVLCCAGAIDDQACLDAAERCLGTLPAGKRAKETAPRLPADPARFHYVRSDDAQTRARLSFRVCSETHADYTALSLIRRVLDGGLSARLPVELIERRGIAYEAYADLECYADCGLFNFEFAVAHKKLGYALTEVGKVILDLVQHGVGEDELERVKRRARVGLALGLDSAAEMNLWFGASQLFHDPITPEARIQRLEAITPAAIKRIARKYFTAARLSVAAVGGADAPTVRAARAATRAIAEAL